MKSSDARGDPRWYQIMILLSFLLYGTRVLDFEVHARTAGAIVSGTLASQYLFSRWVGLPRVDFKSALISGLSLSLLLRTDVIGIGFAAGMLAIGSKFLLRWRHKHIFNPANFALVILTLTPWAWLSPGQWGSAALLSLLIAGLGLVVLNRVGSYDVTLAFLASFAAILFGRALWLGDPLAIPAHQLGSGGLLIFAFFMISDPRTIPDAPLGRCLYGVLVAIVAAAFQFQLYQPNGAIFALGLCAPWVPVFDRYLPAARYRWPDRQTRPSPYAKGVT